MAVNFAQQKGGIPRAGFGAGFKKLFRYLDHQNADGTKKLGTAQTPTGMVVYEAGVEAFRRTIFQFTAMPLVLADNAGVIAWGKQKLYTFPQTGIQFLGAHASLSVNKSSAGVIATWSGKFGLGTATADNTATLSSTEQDIIPSTNIGAATAGVNTFKAQNAAVIAPFDGNTTAKDLWLNMLVNDSDHDVTTTPCNLLVTGYVTVSWLPMGAKATY